MAVKELKSRKSKGHTKPYGTVDVKLSFTPSDPSFVTEGGSVTSAAEMSSPVVRVKQVEVEVAAVVAEAEAAKTEKKAEADAKKEAVEVAPEPPALEQDSPKPPPLLPASSTEEDSPKPPPLPSSPVVTADAALGLSLEPATPAVVSEGVPPLPSSPAVEEAKDAVARAVGTSSPATAWSRKATTSEPTAELAAGGGADTILLNPVYNPTRGSSPLNPTLSSASSNSCALQNTPRTGEYMDTIMRLAAQARTRLEEQASNPAGAGAGSIPPAKAVVKQVHVPVVEPGRKVKDEYMETINRLASRTWSGATPQPGPDGSILMTPRTPGVSGADEVATAAAAEAARKATTSDLSSDQIKALLTQLQTGLVEATSPIGRDPAIEQEEMRRKVAVGEAVGEMLESPIGLDPAIEQEERRADEVAVADTAPLSRFARAGAVAATLASTVGEIQTYQEEDL